MLLKWFPWRWVVRKVARAHGMLDPLKVLARLENLAQPSEVAAPIELLRAGLVLQARGVINGKVIQQNLDWVWPFWVNRQYDPQDPAFLPRGFSLAQVNLTHRNWTAVGVPGCDAMPIVDPRGLVTPMFDGWSLDAWLVRCTGETLHPSRQDDCRQELLLDPDRLAVRTLTGDSNMALAATSFVEAGNGHAACCVDYEGRLDGPGWLVVALRPFNPEGIGLVERVAMASDSQGWEVDGHPAVRFDTQAARTACSTYREGDVALNLLEQPDRQASRCSVGMATAAALFPVADDGVAKVRATVDLGADRSIKRLFPHHQPRDWRTALDSAAALEVPEPHFVFLYRAALRTCVLLSGEETYPGPYTYKRFWFRDAVIMLHAMLGANLPGYAKRAMGRFPRRQRPSGYFHSQSGEWDSNGQVLWLIGQYCELTHTRLPAEWLDSVRRGARWIRRKRTDGALDAPHAGLLPAGFSAEHLGTNDYYYWDDFWSVAGLRAAAKLLAGAGRNEEARTAGRSADDLLAAVNRSLTRSQTIRPSDGIPASPYRRMDAGAVGSLVCSYPLAVWDSSNPRLKATIEFLLDVCMIDDMLFLDTGHSGRNPYLTLQVAQALLRAEDWRFFPLVCSVAAAASPTGQWPEAIHPLTGGGCMGDGQHGWAAAEWLMMMRSLFLREEAGVLVLCSGIPDEWVLRGKVMSFGPAPTPYGPVRIVVQPYENEAAVRWEADWWETPPAIEVRLGGRAVRVNDPQAGEIRVSLGDEGGSG